MFENKFIEETNIKKVIKKNLSNIQSNLTIDKNLYQVSILAYTFTYTTELFFVE